ncbi:DUF2791 family P-loop domain-containing protein [Rhodococcus ruber]|uniref:DUF2791 family P-loop domain-containing protein n=1 Tax=Rhodococcus ruber TaxID=1830 RepID=A0ABT4MKU3_9NOCA|nr:BREX system ATP-binding domain-containing protein [Rhodococcus ruber]MCZ4521586.1 DUF2791 family P-loop domain-containing protein [Rhodococcus ruber]
MTAHSACIELLGTPTVRGTSVVDPRTIGGPRCVEALAYLTVHRHRDVTADELASIIWPRGRPKSWNAAARSVLTKVREALNTAGIPGDSLRSRGGLLQLALPDWVQVDLEVIREFCRRSGGGLPARVRADRAHDAHRALSDPLLRGVVGAWADELQAERVSLLVTALDIDAQASAEDGSFERSISCAEAVISIDPLVERAYRHAMRGHIALGDRAQALEVAARCRRALTEHLGVDPSAETAQLFADALQDDRAQHETFSAAAPLIVGRDTELDAIARTLNSTAPGSSHCVVVTGDAGSGKTTLVREAMRRARASGVTVIFGRCSEDAVVPFEPFVDAIEGQLDDVDSAQLREWVDAHGTDVLRLLPGSAQRFAHIDVEFDASNNDRVSTMNAVRRWLTGTVTKTPTMLVVDDLQWASPASQSLLRYLFQVCTTAAICFVAVARTESLEDVELSATLDTATRLGRTLRLELREFELGHLRELVTAHESNLDPVQLLSTTRGHPLFVTSILAAGRGEDPAERSEYPSSIVSFVRRAEHRLGADARLLLHACAVTGMSVPHIVLRGATGELTNDRFDDALDELVRVRLIAPADDGDLFELRHPIVRDVVYSVIGPGARAALHSKVGRALERTSRDRQDAARLAFHFGRGRIDDRGSAGSYAHRAAENAYALGAYEDAVQHYRRALDWTPVDEAATRCSMSIGLGLSLRAMRDPSARDTAMAALTMARQLGDRTLQNDAIAASERRGMEFVQRYASDAERVAVIDSMCAELEAEGRTVSREYAVLASQRVIEQAWGTDYRERARTIVHAAGIARSLGDTRLLASVNVAALIGLRVPHSADVVAAALVDLDELVDADPSVMNDATVAVWLSRARLEAGDLGGAMACLDAITDAHVDGDPELRWLIDYGRLGVALAAGDLIACEAALDGIRAVPPSPTDTGYYGRLLPALTALRTLRGDMGEVASQAEAMRARTHDNPVLRPALAVALIDVGRTAEATELIEWYTPQRLDAIPVDPMWLSTMTLIARAASELVLTWLCEYVYRLLLDHQNCVVLTWASLYGVVHHHLASLAWALGDDATAHRHIGAARTIHAQRGFAAWSVETDALALRIQAATGSVDVAEVAAVRDRAERIGATAVLRRLRATQLSHSSLGVATDAPSDRGSR